MDVQVIEREGRIQRAKEATGSTQNTCNVFWPQDLDGIEESAFLFGWTLSLSGAKDTIVITSAWTWNTHTHEQISDRTLRRWSRRAMEQMKGEGKHFAGRMGVHLTEADIVGIFVSKGDSHLVKSKQFSVVAANSSGAKEKEKTFKCSLSNQLKIIRYKRAEVLSWWYALSRKRRRPENLVEVERSALKTFCIGGKAGFDKCISLLNESACYLPVTSERDKLLDSKCEMAMCKLLNMKRRPLEISNRHASFRLGSLLVPSFLYRVLQSLTANVKEDTVKTKLHEIDEIVEMQEGYCELKAWKLGFLLDHMAGFLFALFVWKFLEGSSNTIIDCLDHAEETFMLRVVEELKGAPGGLKLYEPLSHLLGNLSLFSLQTYKAARMMINAAKHANLAITIVSGIFGLQTVIALIADAMFVLVLPYILLYHFHACLFRYHLLCTREMWTLFRGKWRIEQSENELETAPLVLEHVIVGVLLVTPLLFLMPTVLVFYLFWLLIFLISKTLFLSIELISVSMHSIPLCMALMRIFLPGLHINGIYFALDVKSIQCTSSEFGQIPLELKPTFQSHVEILLLQIDKLMPSLFKLNLKKGVKHLLTGKPLSLL